MALTLRRAISADSGGLEQVNATQGSPAVVSSPVVDGSHAFEMSPAATQEQIRFARIGGGGWSNDVIIGWKFRTTDLSSLDWTGPPSPTAALRVGSSVGSWREAENSELRMCRSPY